MSFRGSGAGGGFEFRIWFINGVKMEDSAQRQMSVNARMIKNTYCNHFIKYLFTFLYSRISKPRIVLLLGIIT